MDRSFRAFLKERSSSSLPPHRRIDWDYGVKKAVSLLSEIFHGFLRGPYFRYMAENFNEAEE